jgi:[ribosomal protein S18]-alanine N-acetyltransferase
VKVRSLTSTDAATIAAWRYPDEYSTYDVVDPSTLASDHWAVTEGEELVGYSCFGAPARVAGAEQEAGVLDVGYGLAPDLVGRGFGRRFVAAILRFALERYEPQRFRLYILEWNERSQKLAASHGFAAESILQDDERRFLVMVRQASPG